MKVFALLVLVSALMVGSRSHAENCPAPQTPASIAVSNHPFGVVATSDNCWMYVALSNDEGHGGVVALHNEGGTFSIRHAIALDSAGFGEALTHDGRTLLVASGRNTVAVNAQALQRGDANAVMGAFHDGEDALAVYAAVSPDDKWLFVSDEGKARISVFDLSKARSEGFHDVEPLGHIPVAIAPVGLAFSPDGRWLYATSQTTGPGSRLAATCKPEQERGSMHSQGLLLRIDMQKIPSDTEHAMVAAIPVGCNPVRVALSPSGKQIWVTTRGDNAVVRVQTDKWLAQDGKATVRHFPIGESPVGVTVRPDGTQVWVAVSNRFGNDNPGQLVGLSNAKNDEPAKRMVIDAAGFPREVIFLPDGNTLTATLFKASRVMVEPTAKP